MKFKLNIMSLRRMLFTDYNAQAFMSFFKLYDFTDSIINFKSRKLYIRRLITAAKRDEIHFNSDDFLRPVFLFFGIAFCIFITNNIRKFYCDYYSYIHHTKCDNET